MQNAEHFLKTMSSLDPLGSDDPDEYNFTDAIVFALEQVPLIDDATYFGEIDGAGVFYSNSRESRWWPNATVEMVATIIAGEML